MTELKITLSLDEDEAYKAWLKAMERMKEVEQQFLEATKNDPNE